MNTPRTPLPLMFGIPDDGMAQIYFQPGKPGPQVSFPGNLNVVGYLDRSRGPWFQAIYCGPRVTTTVDEVEPGRPVVNAVTEPHRCSVALRTIEAVVAKTQANCFNHPAAIQGTRRDLVSERLAGIEGLCMPRTLRLRIDEPAELGEAIARAGLSWPVLLRVAGDHGGKDLTKVDRPEDLRAALRDLPWGGRPVYVTEFVDFRGDDGLYRKMRLVVAGREIFLRHHIPSADWLVHADSRVPRAELLERELQELEGFDQGLLPVLRERVLAIADALGLDYFGIDASLLPDGRLLVFEANATMNVLHDSNPQEPRWAGVIARIRRGLESLLENPGRWRHAPAGTRQ